MALALVLEDAPDDAVKGFYVEKDGKYHLDVTGVEDTNQLRIELATVKREAAERRKAAKELEERFAGIDPEKVKSMMAKLDQDGEAKLLAEGKIDEVVNKRTEKLRADLQKQLDEAHGKATSAEARVKQYSQKALDNVLRAAAIKAKIHEEAIDDVLLRGRSMFELDESGIAIQRDADGNLILGKDGKTPFQPDEWLENPPKHWVMNSASGGGASGSGNSSGGSKTMKRAQFDALPARDKASAAKQYQIVD